MRFTIRSLATFVAAALLALSLAASAQDLQTEIAYQPPALAQDLAVLRAAIDEGHPGALRYMTEAELRERFDVAASQGAAPLTARAFYRVLAPLIAGLNDGHTSIDLSEPDSAAFREHAPLLPLRVRVSGGRVFVLRDLSGGRLAGQEIVAINGERVGAILAEMMAATPGDGRIVTGRESRLSQGFRFSRLYALLRAPSATYRLALRTRIGRRERALSGATQAALDQAWAAQFPADRAQQAPAAMSYRDEGAIAVLTIRGFDMFADLAESQRMEDFLAQSFGDMKTRGTRALVIDVRDNGGGRDELGRRLFGYLAAASFEYYSGLYLRSRAFSFSEHAAPPIPGPPPNLYEADAEGRLRVRSNENYGVHQPEADRFAGPVFVLMNGGSFSTTSEFLSVAHAHHRATFIGEEAGGGYYGNTSGLSLTVTLPNTGMRLRLPVQRYELAVTGFSPADRGVPPDHRAVPAIADILAERDRAMETALRLARRRT